MYRYSRRVYGLVGSMGLVWVGDRGTCPPPCFWGWGTKGTMAPSPHVYFGIFFFIHCRDTQKITSFEIAPNSSNPTPLTYMRSYFLLVSRSFDNTIMKNHKARLYSLLCWHLQEKLIKRVTFLELIYICHSADTI